MLEDRQECPVATEKSISVRENRAGRRLSRVASISVSWLCFAYEGRGVEVKNRYILRNEANKSFIINRYYSEECKKGTRKRNEIR